MRTIIPVVAAFSLLIVAGPAEASGPTAEWTQWTEKPDWPPRFPDHVTGEMGEVVVDHFGSVHPRTLVDGNCGWPWEIWVTPIPYAPDDVFLSEEVHNGPYGCSSIALNGAGGILEIVTFSGPCSGRSDAPAYAAVTVSSGSGWRVPGLTGNPPS